MTKLYIVATPIGNLSDMTYRAIDTLKEVDLIIAEDTRQTKKLSNHYEIDTPLTSFHAQSGKERAKQLCDEIISQNKEAAYVSDAGTPCISDPGFILVREAIAQGIEIIPIPGASALTTLVSVAGVPVDSFQWHGFIPHKKGRKTLIESFQENKSSAIFYESVHRFPKLLKELAEYIGEDRLIVVGRELTKMHEDIFRGSVAEAQAYYTDENTRGEFVVIIPPVNFTFTS